MEYRHLPETARADLVKQSLLQAEHDHAIHTLNATAAAADGNDAVAQQQRDLATAAEARRDALEAGAAEAVAVPTPVDEVPTDS